MVGHQFDLGLMTFHHIGHCSTNVTNIVNLSIVSFDLGLMTFHTFRPWYHLTFHHQEVVSFDLGLMTFHHIGHYSTNVTNIVNLSIVSFDLGLMTFHTF
jgi:hypothetical protein